MYPGIVRLIIGIDTFGSLDSIKSVIIVVKIKLLPRPVPIGLHKDLRRSLAVNSTLDPVALVTEALQVHPAPFVATREQKIIVIIIIQDVIHVKSGFHITDGI